MTNQLITVFNDTISGEHVLLCNARDLHKFLGVGKRFASWVTERIEQYGFVENIDFRIASQIREAKTRGGHNRKDYHLTLDTAKELAMVERNAKGRQVRRYFIECEKKLHQQSSTVLAPHRECLPKMVYHATSKYNPYRAYVTEKGKAVYVGCYPTVDDAVAAQENYFSRGEVKRIQKPRSDIREAEKEMFTNNLRALCHHFRSIDKIWRSQLRPALTLAESKLVSKLYDRFNDSMCILPTIEDLVGKYVPPKR